MTFELCVFDLTHKELLEKAFLEYLLCLVPSCHTRHLNPSSCYSARWNFSKVSGKYQGKAKKAGRLCLLLVFIPLSALARLRLAYKLQGSSQGAEDRRAFLEGVCFLAFFFGLVSKSNAINDS